jgi:hypothetical protein
MGDDGQIGVFALGNFIADFDIQLILLIVFHFHSYLKSGDSPQAIPASV